MDAIKFELTHKCTLLQQLFLSSTWTECSQGRGLCTFWGCWCRWCHWPRRNVM